MPCTWVMACAYAPSGCAVACGWVSFYPWRSKCGICLVFCFFGVNWSYFLSQGPGQQMLGVSSVSGQEWELGCQEEVSGHAHKLPVCLQLHQLGHAGQNIRQYAKKHPQNTKSNFTFSLILLTLKFLQTQLLLSVSLSLLIRNHCLPYSSGNSFPILLIIHSSRLLLVWCPGHMMLHTAKTISSRVLAHIDFY